MLSSSIVIRDYQQSDHGGCLAAFRSNVPTYFNETEISEFEDFLGALDDIYLDSIYLVAELGDRIIGCGGCHVAEGGEGRLIWGLVQCDYHRRSVGSALLAARLKLLFENDSISRVGIDTSQHTAAFFERFGFVRASVVENGHAPGLDLVRMHLSRDRWIGQASVEMDRILEGVSMHPHRARRS